MAQIIQSWRPVCECAFDLGTCGFVQTCEWLFVRVGGGQWGWDDLFTTITGSMRCMTSACVCARVFLISLCKTFHFSFMRAKWAAELQKQPVFKIVMQCVTCSLGTKKWSPTLIEFCTCGVKSYSCLTKNMTQDEDLSVVLTSDIICKRCAQINPVWVEVKQLNSILCRKSFLCLSPTFLYCLLVF